MELGREADNVHSLARLKPMNQVGGKADTCGGLSTDTYFLFGNGAEGGVAVEPEAVFHGWRSARRECLPGGTQWSGSRAGATCRSGWNQAFLTEHQRRKKGLTACSIMCRKMWLSENLYCPAEIEGF